jgi:Family of unknown function (DUF6519)
MTIDRARNSYDPTRDWRAVLAQQGRVTLEADVNEQGRIVQEERRREAVDIIGPVGSPDGGYTISVTAAGTDIQVAPGTIHLGGWRLVLPPPGLSTASQPGWLDMPAWPAPAGNQSIALLAIEQTVIAVEDTALQEVALGGPDSAGRLSLLQHILRIPTAAATCADGENALAALATANGQTWNPATGQLTSTATLLVTPVTGTTTPGPCDPPSQGGYIGADNQMIRVAVIQYDPTSRSGTLVWGWNNASFLYRATLAQANTLNFLATPVDPDHTPQQGQAVEILLSTLDLGDGDRSKAGGGNFIAAAQGVLMILGAGQGYNGTTQQLTLPNNLTGQYVSQTPDANGTVPPLFVRLWQATVNFTAGTPVPLGNTGLNATINNPPLNTAIGNRPYWQFAVRPSTPTQVYPQRYLTAPQPPDGPRQFLAELGVAGWSSGKFNLLANCVPPFLPLTKQPTGCCEIVLGPADVSGRGGLQAVVDSVKGGPAIISLRPGTYTLATPLVLGSQHAGLVLQGCSGGVTLQADSGNIGAFLFGMIAMLGVSNIALRRLNFTIPAVPGPAAAGAAPPNTLVGLAIAAAQSLTVEDCNFALDQGTALSSGSAIFAVGALSAIIVRCSTFSMASAVAGAALSGIAVVTNQNVTTTLDTTQVIDCHIQNITTGVVVYGQFGLVRCTGNVVTNCTTGFYFSQAAVAATNAFVRQAASINIGDSDQTLAASLVAVYKPAALNDFVTNTAAIIAKLVPTSPPPTIAAPAQQALANQFANVGLSTFTTLKSFNVQTSLHVASATLNVAPTLAQNVAAPINTAAVPAAATTTPAAAAAQPVFQIPAAALNNIDNIAIAVTAAAPSLTPALRFDANEISLGSTQGAAGIGIGAIFGIGAALSTVMVNANRITAPDGNTAACGIAFAAGATVIGNVLSQLGAGRTNVPLSPALIVLAERGNPFQQIAGNITHPSEFIFPPRSAPTSTGGWDFLNTIG